VQGLDKFPRENWPQPLALLYYSYHIMAGLGTYFGALMGLAVLLLWWGKLYTTRWILWQLMHSFPLPYIATTAGWVTAEVGRQPWIVYGLMRTSTGYSKYVSSGNALFTLLGFAGLYTVLGILFLALVYREIHHGPHREHLPVATTLTGV
jgi:cytochrome d ubiquinol oxidase subunit I